MPRTRAGVAAMRSEWAEWTAQRRIVVKIGSALLVDNGRRFALGLARRAVRRHCRASQAKARKSSWCRQARSRSGETYWGYPKGPLKLEDSQASAAVGQVHLGPCV